jgi:hypothetical protein
VLAGRRHGDAIHDLDGDGVALHQLAQLALQARHLGSGLLAFQLQLGGQRAVVVLPHAEEAHPFRLVLEQGVEARRVQLPAAAADDQVVVPAGDVLQHTHAALAALDRSVSDVANVVADQGEGGVRQHRQYQVVPAVLARPRLDEDVVLADAEPAVGALPGHVAALGRTVLHHRRDVEGPLDRGHQVVEGRLAGEQRQLERVAGEADGLGLLGKQSQGLAVAVEGGRAE